MDYQVSDYLVPFDREDLWMVMMDYRSYNTEDKLRPLINREITSEMMEIWMGTSRESFRQRQLWLFQAIPPGKCCGD